MKTDRAGLLAAALGALFAAGACSSMNARDDAPAVAAQRRALTAVVIGAWSEESAAAARLMIDEYGVADEVLSERLVWNDKGPWRRTVVRDVRPFYIQERDPAVVEQTVDYALTPPQAGAVAAAFGDRVRYDPRTRELTARSDREELNYLRLNLAHDVAVGALPPERARDECSRLMMLEDAGKTSPDLLGLRFMPSIP